MEGAAILGWSLLALAVVCAIAAINAIVQMNAASTAMEHALDAELAEKP